MAYQEHERTWDQRVSWRKVVEAHALARAEKDEAFLFVALIDLPTLQAGLASGQETGRASNLQWWL